MVIKAKNKTKTNLHIQIISIHFLLTFSIPHTISFSFLLTIFLSNPWFFEKKITIHFPVTHGKKKKTFGATPSLFFKNNSEAVKNFNETVASEFIQHLNNCLN